MPAVQPALDAANLAMDELYDRSTRELASSDPDQLDERAVRLFDIERRVDDDHAIAGKVVESAVVGGWRHSEGKETIAVSAACWTNDARATRQASRARHRGRRGLTTNPTASRGITPHPGSRSVQSKCW